MTPRRLHVPPESERAIAAVREYLARSDMAIADFAYRVRYARSTIKNWLNRLYPSDDELLRGACIDYIERNPVAADEAIQGRLYHTANLQMLRQWFYAVVDRGWVVVGHGNPGTQKTFGIRALIGELNRADAGKNGGGRRAWRVYCSQAITPIQLLRKMAGAAAVPSSADLNRLISNLQHECRARRAAFVLDEAQHLSVPCLETVRELWDEPPHFGVLFLGSHNLVQQFNHPELEQWRRRIRVMQSLPGLSESEAREIIGAELPAASEKQIRGLIDDSKPKDFARRPYISVGRLTEAIAAIKERLPQKGSAT